MNLPENVSTEMLDYLDDLRESGAVNMYLVTPYLQDEFGLDKNEARSVLKYWMDTFVERQRQCEQQ